MTTRKYYGQSQRAIKTIYGKHLNHLKYSQRASNRRLLEIIKVNNLLPNKHKIFRFTQ